MVNDFGAEPSRPASSLWAGVNAFAGAIRPLIGGLLVDAAGWRTIFLINLPVGLAAAWLAWRFVPESRDHRGGAQPDWLGALLGAVSLGLCTWVLTAAAKPGADEVRPIGSAVVGFALLPAFAFVEFKRGEDALVPLYLRVGARCQLLARSAAATLVVALGMAVCVAPLTTTVMNSVNAGHVGAASGFNSAAARLGGLIATALWGSCSPSKGLAPPWSQAPTWPRSSARAWRRLRVRAHCC
jgi:predicted MFS family arabinose efflux permease